MAELVAEHADVVHLRAAFLHDEVRPPLAVVADARPVRPVQPAACGLHPLPGVDEEHAVVIFQRILPVLGEHFVHRLRQKSGFFFGARAAPAGVFLAFLADFDPADELALNGKLAVRNLPVVIGHAAVDALAGCGLVRVLAQRKHRRFPIFVVDLRVVLHVRVFHANDGELINRLLPSLRQAIVPTHRAAAGSGLIGEQRDADFLFFLVPRNQQLHDVAGLFVVQRFTDTRGADELRFVNFQHDVAHLHAGFVTCPAGRHAIDDHAPAGFHLTTRDAQHHANWGRGGKRFTCGTRRDCDRFRRLAGLNREGDRFIRVYAAKLFLQDGTSCHRFAVEFHDPAARLQPREFGG